MSLPAHAYPFDPNYGYSLERLLKVGAPEEPEDFQKFWHGRYLRVLAVEPRPVLKDTGVVRDGMRVHELRFQSTDGVGIGGWCLVPIDRSVKRAFVVSHGYGGREGPDYHLPISRDAAIFFPCSRGISRSPHPGISADPARHVLHGIERPETYVMGGCVDDVWLTVSSALSLFPDVAGRIGLLGISFGGGVGAMALAWDERVSRAHFNVPTFGNQPLRLKMPTVGSGAAVIAQHQHTPEAVERTLSYYDAALAARHFQVPVHFACALFDPMVAPPGQFAIHNASPAAKALFVLQAGHFEYPDQIRENLKLLREINEFFQPV